MSSFNELMGNSPPVLPPPGSYDLGGNSSLQGTVQQPLPSPYTTQSLTSPWVVSSVAPTVFPSSVMSDHHDNYHHYHHHDDGGDSYHHDNYHHHHDGSDDGSNDFVSITSCHIPKMFVVILGFFAVLLVMVLIVMFFYMLFSGSKSKCRSSSGVLPSPSVPPVVTPPSSTLTDSNNDPGGVPSTSQGIVELFNGQDLTTTACVPPNGQWINSKCKCTQPYHGPECKRIAWDSRFFAFGHASDPSTLTFTGTNVGPQNKTWFPGGAYDTNSCSAQALVSPYIGFQYLNGNCTLLNNLTLGSGAITFDSLHDSDLYINRTFTPNVPGKVFLMAQNNHQLRFYLTQTNSTTFSSLPLNKVVRVDFTPYDIVNTSGATGVWSKDPFTVSDFNTVRLSGQAYVDTGHTGRYILTIPSQFLSGTYYIMYS
jgi:hypothetical protein